MKTCPQCNTSNRSEAKFCVSCGFNFTTAAAQLSKPTEPQFCTSCGSANEASAGFCTNCGAVLASPKTPTPAVPSTVQSVPSAAAPEFQPPSPAATPISTPPAPSADSVAQPSDSSQAPDISSSSPLTPPGDNVKGIGHICSSCGSVMRFCPSCGAPLVQTANGQMAHGAPAPSDQT